MEKQGKRFSTDVLVVGGGMAGCMAAIKAKESGAEVILVDKGYVSTAGQTPYADSFCIFNEDWGHNMDEWLDAVSKGGDYVSNRDWMKIVLEGSYGLYLDLSSYGIEFHSDDEGNLIQIEGDVAPLTTCFLKEKMKSCITLRQQVLKKGATIMDRVMITDLIKVDGRICGAVGMTVEEGDFVIIDAKAVVITTGASSLKCTGWPNSGLTADGDMMAYRAGASLTGKEYNDVHTTSVFFPTCVGPRFLRKAIAGPPPANYENALGEKFKAPTLFHMGPEFEAHRGNAPIAWNVRKSPDGKKNLITAGSTVGMSTHKSEGIWPVGLEGGTQLPGLYGAGDALGVMLCGAAYSAAGASVCGSGVIGARAGKAAARHAAQYDTAVACEEVIAPLRTRLYAPSERKGGFSPDWVLQTLKNLMVPYFILYIKEEERLQATLSMLTFYRSHLLPKIFSTDPHDLRLALECDNLLLNCEMKMRAALHRKESRGTHYREDYPQRDEKGGLYWLLLTDKDGEIVLTEEKVPEAWHPDFNIPFEDRYLMKFPDFRNEEG